MKEVEMGWACGMYGRRRELHTVFWRGYLKEGDPSEE
jgi:hypothetical protein